MEDFMGDYVDPAAEGQEVGTNSYQQESEDYPVDASLLDQPVKPGIEEEKQPNSNPQAEHFRALREEVDRIKAEREAEKKDYQVQLDMLRANLSQQKQSQPEQKPNEMFAGMREDDVPSVAEIRKEWGQREAAYQAHLEELQVQQAHPDYAEVIEKFALPLVQQKPHLAEGLQGARNKALFAYELGKMAQQMQQPQQTQPEPVAPQRSENAERMVSNSRKPGTLSQAGGQSTLSKADYYATMSDQEFMRMASKNLEEI